MIYLFLGYKIIVKKLISIGDFSLYLNAITTFNSSVQAMIAAYIDISNNGQYIKDYFDFIELLGRADSNGIKLEEKDYLDAEIVFENVSFIYPNQEKKSLSNINLTIKKGERISIVGENGAGKTTFIKLLLRLYEPTAALDPRAEYEIYTRFLALVESKTSIFISHRLSSTKFCDRIVLFKDGSIEETGTHNELLQKGGLYAELFRMQAQFYFDN